MGLRAVNTRLKGACLTGALCFFAFSAVLTGGCAANKAAKPDNAAVTRPVQYSKVLDRWSRGIKVYEGFETRLYLNATFKSPEFRRAYIDKFAKNYELGPERKKALLDREEEQGQAYNEFFFTAYTPDERLNDFDKKESVWQLYLEDGQGGKTRPISVTRVDNSDVVIREYFPYFDLWSRAYVAQFPKFSENGKEIAGPGAGEMKLVVTGVMGKGELVWQFK